MGPRAGLSSVLILGAIVLLVAIAVGENMGNRVLGAIPVRPLVMPATPIPAPSATDDTQASASWKRHEVISVATDPGFPDPRVTPEPPPPETPRPVPRFRPTPQPTPSPSPPPSERPRDGRPPYTSPPLPLPLVTREPDPGETDELPTAATPSPFVTGRGEASLPSYASTQSP